MRPRNARGVLLDWLTTGLVAAAAASTLAACGGPKPQPKAVAPIVRDIPEPLRGTIGAEASIRGVEPQLVSGFGLVVGLNGTGGGEIPPAIAATMERELARGGVGKGGLLDVGPLAGKTPKQVLRDPNVAVVIVEAAVIPGAPAGTRFDVWVRTLPGSSVTSLEGGTLWTTDLRLGPATSFGGYKTRRIAEARGEIFINPFAEPGANGEMAVGRTTGRVLGGGVVVEPLQLEIVLDNPSHTRASAMVSAINYRFPPGPGDDGPTARGRNAESIAVSVPAAYRDKIGDFLELVRCLRIDQSFPQEFARRYVEELKQNPGLADDLSWCLEAIGKPAIPFLSTMYDYPELAPRLAALRAGARLGDMRAVPHLVDLAKNAPAAIRTDAIALLGDMPTNPQINFALRELVNEEDLDVRVAAYEALAARNDPSLIRIPVGPNPLRPSFVIDAVPAKDPLIYVSQEREPKVVIFGAGQGEGTLELTRPVLISAWSDRLMLSAESPGSPVRLYYRDFRTNRASVYAAPEDVLRFIELLGHKQTPDSPEPGLGLSYSEVVGALYEIHRQGGINAAFATGYDRLLAELLKASQVTAVTDRPETNQEPIEGPVIVFRPEGPAQRSAEPFGGSGAAPSGNRPSMVVPLNTGRADGSQR